ncbi:MAG: MotA/TolQ/ExbB proton channel family protein [Acidobacteria bacterium]|nr:MotA/TolQ/ExbB proton channel family protein [Acidobacteriota bacterium]
MNRAVAELHAEMGRGINSLATISTIAPWLGIFATVDGIIGAFGGGSGEKSAMLAAVTMRLSEAIWPAAMGLAVGILAFVIHRTLTQRLTNLRQQTLLLQAEFTTLLRACHGNWQCASDETPPFAGFPWTTQTNTHPFAVAVLLTFAWLTQSLAYVIHGGYYPEWAFFRAAWYTAFVFAICLAPACVIWVKVLGRSQEAIGLLTAAMCLIWSIVECVSGLHLL